ncbi:MAG: DUF1572 family protein, partial [Planctomycetota bacterium]
DPSEEILIRGEPHRLSDAVWRSVTHISYHTGQIVMIARWVHDGEWRWLTIPPGGSSNHNQQTWGSSRSRSVFGEDREV